MIMILIIIISTLTPAVEPLVMNIMTIITTLTITIITILTPAVEPLVCLAAAQTPREPVKTRMKPPGGDCESKNKDRN